MLTKVRNTRETFLKIFPSNDACDFALGNLQKLHEKLDKTVKNKENELSLAIVEMKEQLSRI